MDKNMVLAIVLSMLVLILYPLLMNKDHKVQEQKQITSGQNIPQETEKKNSVPVKTKTINTRIEKNSNSNIKENIYVLENRLLKLTFSSLGAGIKQAEFKLYKDKEKKHIRFFANEITQLGAFNISSIEKINFSDVKIDQDSIVFSSNDVMIAYTISDDRYVVKTNIKSKKGPLKSDLRILALRPEDIDDNYGLNPDPSKRVKQYLVYSEDKLQTSEIEELAESGPITFNSNNKWLGLSNRYFLFALIPQNPENYSIVLSKTDLDFIYSLDFKETVTAPDLNFQIYIGPKDVNDLAKVDRTLTKAVDYGWLTLLSVPMLEAMKFFYKIIPNYGLAIILLTLMVRLLMFPLQHKSMKSMKRLQELQPNIKKLQEKHKDNKEVLNREMMQFMKTHKVNPMGGCFPMLLQLPIFIALYKVLGNAVELYQSPFIFWITDLSVKDSFYVLPVLMGIMMFLQQKMTPNPTMDPAQAKMMMFMPLIFTFFMINLPSGLTLYILFSTLFGILQQYATNKYKAKNS